MQWMIYGATGFTGTLVAEEAVRRGHQPIIAGRSLDKLRALSRRLDLEYAAFSLTDISTIGEAIADMDVVYHAAGPFIYTSEPMLRACLATHTHYLDISGHIAVIENTYSYDEAARSNGIALISGAGFDVIPSDCLAAFVAAQIPTAVQLEIGISGFHGMSAGTTKANLEIIADGGLVRRDGHLVRMPVGHKTRNIPFSHRTLPAMAVPWGDMAAVYRSTGVPNITSYMALHPLMIALAKVSAPLGEQLFKSSLLKQAAGSFIDRWVAGPAEQTRTSERSYFWAQASTENGQIAEARLETPEPYQLTAKLGVLAVEKLLANHPIGALSPVQAFGADFILDVEGTRRIV